MKKLNEDISRLRKLMSLNEAPTSSNTLFGGSNVTIPKDGAHAGQSGWQSASAWDVPADIDTPVYSLTTGTLLTFSDYGQKPIRTQGKTLFGASFTVQGSKGMPDVYYTHLKNPQVKKGDTVECGQLLGYVMDFPGSSYDHVHIGVKPPATLRDLIDSNGKIKCGGGNFISKDKADSLGSGSTNLNLSNIIGATKKRYDSLLGGLVQSLFSGVNEGKIYSDFGKKTKISSNALIIPEKSNSKIESPIDGKIENYSYNSSCANQLCIKHLVNGEIYYLEYCGIDNPSVSIGDSVTVGTKLGTSNSDVKVFIYNKNGRREYIKDFVNKEEKEKKDDDDGGGGRPSKKRYDPLMIGLLSFPKQIIKNLSSGGFQSVTNKKVTEDIERIKKLL